MTNWLTADQASAMITPSANMRRTIGRQRTAAPGPVAARHPPSPAGAPGRAGPETSRASASMAASATSTGVEARAA